MQYILSEEEYSELKNRSETETQKSKAIINELCQMVCNYRPMHIEYPYRSNMKYEPYGCNPDQYCDPCCVKQYCTLPQKNFSK